MIGKCYYNNEWHLLIFEKDKLILKILKEKCFDKPLQFSEKGNNFYDANINLNNNYILSFLEDGSLYIFDINSGIKIDQYSEYYTLVIEKISYYFSELPDFNSLIYIKYFNKIIIYDWILKAMLDGVYTPVELDTKIGMA